MGALRFETFTLDIPGRLLKQGERRLALRRQPFKVLTYLAERPDRLVTNRELIESVLGESQTDEREFACAMRQSDPRGSGRDRSRDHQNRPRPGLRVRGRGLDPAGRRPGLNCTASS